MPCYVPVCNCLPATAGRRECGDGQLEKLGARSSQCCKKGLKRGIRRAECQYSAISNSIIFCLEEKDGDN